MVSKPKTASKEDPTIALQRHLLGSIDLSDVEEQKDQNESERKEYVAAISAVFPRIERDIKKFLYAQLMFQANEAVTWEQVIFGRGTFNGMDLLLEHWRKADMEFRGKIADKEEFDKNNPLPEL